MVLLSRYRSTWGIPPGPEQNNWKCRLREWKLHGYSGIELNLSFDGNPIVNLENTRQFCDFEGLEIAVVMFSSWPKDAGSTPGLSVEAHIDFYKAQLEIASNLRPVVITAQSGSDCWTLEESVQFYKRTLQIDKEFGLQGKICHETHRRRSLFNIRVAADILQQVPESIPLLKITADISHWVVVGERLLNQGNNDIRLLASIIPHVRRPVFIHFQALTSNKVNHIHARIGTTQSSQCPEPANPAFAAEREFFERFWLDVIEYKQYKSSGSCITWVPEYGPFPYHPIGSMQAHEDLADSEAKRLEMLSTNFSDMRK
ncbi:hypothetical protein N7509_012651 [Penicillium cosmopolitanum]|uniref:Xylose isomerase-like TIM barrel domain-containing protein n=1 Tax=Penicillium cosmopolitanum TaxID=1131564 RepID=A0A9W9SJW3_9EURO|nr:uncharacterized protein N7509_012651 [Penicillium cosmopolitanum]KAJ5379532.1 hypothetical protein N7509_012651 [Penicillium cosmopolitanum]